MTLLAELEQMILLAIVRLQDDAYAVSIHAEIEKRTGLRLARGTVYVTLSRLEKKGYVTSSFADPTPERGGKAKRFFRAKPDALRLLRRSRAAMERMWADLDPALGKSG